MSRVYNFSAGPAVLPEEVLREAAAEMLDYQGSGMSVMEMSHRSKDFQAIIDDAEKDLRELMQIPDNYKVLFVQGGGNMQFAMVPMNLFKNKVGDYIITGQWAKKAYQEAKMFGTANAIASSQLQLQTIINIRQVKFRFSRLVINDLKVQPVAILAEIDSVNPPAQMDRLLA